MDWIFGNQSALELLLIFLLIGALPVILRHRVQKVAEAGSGGFANVFLVFDTFDNAFKVASITGIGIFTFLASTLVAVYWTDTGNFTIPVSVDGLSIWICAALIACLSGICFGLSFLYNYYLLRESVAYNFTGLGPGLENLYQRNFLIVSHDGIMGIISILWKEFGSLERKDATTILIKTQRRPLWLYNRFGMNQALLRFSSSQDSDRFIEEIGKYRPASII